MWVQISTQFATLIGAIIAGSVALAGVFLTSVLSLTNARRELRLRRLELELAGVQSQIEEFYGPLFSLIQVHQATWEILSKIRNELRKEDNPCRELSEVTHEAGEHVWSTSFAPVHASMIDIIRTKLHLLEDLQSVNTFKTYIQHVQMEKVQKSLYAEKGIRNDSVVGTPFPDDIIQEIERGLEAAKTRYSSLKERIAGV